MSVVTACNARPPETYPFWQNTLVACHLPAGHEGPHTWDVQAAGAQYHRGHTARIDYAAAVQIVRQQQRLAEEFAAERDLYLQALTRIAGSRRPTRARHLARLALAGQGQRMGWRLPSFMDTFDVRALVVERQAGHLTDAQFVTELARYLALPDEGWVSGP